MKNSLDASLTPNDTASITAPHTPIKDLCRFLKRMLPRLEEQIAWFDKEEGLALIKEFYREAAGYNHALKLQLDEIRQHPPSLTKKQISAILQAHAEYKSLLLRFEALNQHFRRKYLPTQH